MAKKPGNKTKSPQKNARQMPNKAAEQKNATKLGADHKAKTPKAGGLEAGGPLSLSQARQMVAQRRSVDRKAELKDLAIASPAYLAKSRREREQALQRLRRRQLTEYKKVMALLDKRGVLPEMAQKRRGKGMAAKIPEKRVKPLRILAEGDSWFCYPVPGFGGGILPRLERKLGVPIISLAKAGDEVRYMLGVEERKKLKENLQQGSPAGGNWDALLFSGGGNDIVGDPMVLLLKYFDPAGPPSRLIAADRVAAALRLIIGGYEDLIELRDTYSPTTHLFFHVYDFAIPDGRGICNIGPWLAPSFQTRRFPTYDKNPASQAVVEIILKQFAEELRKLVAKHASTVTLVETQGKLPPGVNSWHNELHPSDGGFNIMAQLFFEKIKLVFPAQIP